PEPDVGQADAAVVVVGSLPDQLDEERLGSHEVAGPTLQLGEPETALEVVGVPINEGAIDLARVGEASLTAQRFGALLQGAVGVGRDLSQRGRAAAAGKQRKRREQGRESL